MRGMRRVEYGEQEALVFTRSGWKLMDSLREKGVHVNCDCNPKTGASSGQCAIKYPRGEQFLLTAPTELEVKVLGQEKIDKGYRLGCQAVWK